MTGPSTRKALALRAGQASSWLHKWAKQLENEMKSQDVKFQNGRDDHDTMSLTRRTVREMVRGMYHHSIELGRFSN